MTTIVPLVLLLLTVGVPRSDGEVDEGHTENEYVRCISQEGAQMPFPFGVQYNAEVVDYSCIETYLYFVTQSKRLDGVQTAWLDDLYGRFRAEETLARNGQLPIRERKEYRMLTIQERTLFHRAMTAFKNDRAKKYEALTSLHVGETSRAAHHGPGYLVWNRIFLDLFELALREYESDVTLPYWDNTLDSQLKHPTQSLIWSPDYAGNGDGLVTTGPFANWVVEGRKLMRNIGESGRLMKPADITKIMTGEFSISDITFPNAAHQNNLELHSYGVRLWVGGDMGLLQTATNDPMYFLTNAYIDCVWQDFRDVQELNGTNPQTDWPTKFGYYVTHYPNERLGVVPDIRNRAGLSDSYGKRMYRCVKPTCSSDLLSRCGSTGALRCNVITQSCEAVASLQTRPSLCLGSSGYQNSYCVNETAGDCQERHWVYLPVQVSYIRPREFSYPVKAFMASSFRTTTDIYSSAMFSAGAYNTSVRRAHLFPAPQIEECRCSTRDSGRAYVQSYGLDYSGAYREYSVVDKRLPISSAWTYVAVKNPRYAPEFQIRALIRVYDDCGRICTPFCRLAGSQEYQRCSGVVLVSTAKPLYYSSSIENAVYANWEYGDMTPYPRQKRDLTFLKFFCDHSAIFLWGHHPYIQNPYKDPPEPPVDPTPAPFTTTTTTTTTTAAPATTTVTSTTTTQPTTTVLIESEWCFNESQCFKDYEPTNCSRCEHHTFSLCWDHCGKYLHCYRGVWHVKDCPGRLLWDDRSFVKTCNYPYNIVCREDSLCVGCNRPTQPPPPRPTRGRTRG